MNLISKVKKIAVCGVASLGLLVSTGNLGLSAMNPYQFSGFGINNFGNQFGGFNGQNASQFHQNANEDNSMDVEEEPQQQQHIQPQFPANQEQSQRPVYIFENAYNDFRTGTFFNARNPGIPAQAPGMAINGFRTGMFAPAHAPAPAPAAPAAHFPAILVGVPTRIEPFSAISLHGREVRSLSNRERVEFARRAEALRGKNKTWQEIEMLIGISQGTLRNWIRSFKGIAVAKYTELEKINHVFTYLEERRVIPALASDDYAERHGLRIDTFRTWVGEYLKKFPLDV